LGERIVAIKMFFNASISEMMGIFATVVSNGFSKRKIRKGKRV
jgi:hypothetical protein